MKNRFVKVHNINMVKILISALMLFQYCIASSQTGVTETYINPVIPGDHPDPTLTKMGNDFYSSGSSFNPTPKIYHSTDLVHWEVISQPVSASWSQYGNSPGGGIWGGHMVFYKGSYWHFFGKGGGSMYFVKAEKPEGPWSDPVKMNVPAGVPSLGVDNSIFIDDDNKWYLLTKAGQENNHIVELGDNGQPNGKVLNLTWLNPNSEGNPYGWAEGPVMWKHKGYYYYSFAQHLVGSQYVMRSDTLTDEKSKWTIIGTNIFTGTVGAYSTPNHISPAVELEDGTSWVIAHSYHSEYKAQGRQGLLCQVVYDANEFPKILRPQTNETTPPALKSNGIPWMVPHSDNFNSAELNPEWSFLGFTPANTWSLTEKTGWLKLAPNSSGKNTVIKNDGEHNYSLITRVDFEPTASTQEAGLWIINGPETHQVKLVSTAGSEGKKVIAFSFENTRYEVENPVGSVIWLRLIRNEHLMSGYFSPDGFSWTQVGTTINANNIDIEQSQFNNFTGNQQGLYVKGKSAFFDLYIYRDGYSAISAANPANKYKLTVTASSTPPHILSSVNNADWAMYAGVEFGNDDYIKQADSVQVEASSATNGGVIEFLPDSLNGTKIAEIEIGKTGSWSVFKKFSGAIATKISGYHDVYLKFTGAGTGELFRLKTITFSDKDMATSLVNPDLKVNQNEYKFELMYPDPFSPVTKIKYYVPHSSVVSLKVYNANGTVIQTLCEGNKQPGNYELTFNAEVLPNGIYFCRFTGGNYAETKKLIIVK